MNSESVFDEGESIFMTVAGIVSKTSQLKKSLVLKVLFILLCYSLLSSLKDHFNDIPLALEKAYTLRLRLIREKCEQHKKTHHEYAKEIPLLYVPQYNFSYCMISKTGTTTMLNQFKSILSLGSNVMEIHTHFKSKI